MLKPAVFALEARGGNVCHGQRTSRCHFSIHVTLPAPMRPAGREPPSYTAIVADDHRLGVEESPVRDCRSVQIRTPCADRKRSTCSGRRIAFAACAMHRQTTPQRRRRCYPPNRDRGLEGDCDGGCVDRMTSATSVELFTSGSWRIQGDLNLEPRMSIMKAVVVRFMLGAVIVAPAIFGGQTANAQAYPTRPITAVIPFVGGSASDVVSRILFERMSRAMGQPIVVENRAGAGGNIGTQAVARATPDGYTLIGDGSGPIGANVSLYKNLGYDPVKDLEIISPFAGFTIVVVASNSLPVKSLKELIDYAKSKPGLNYGSVGIGSSQHLAGEYFSQITGVKLTHVPYRNIAQYGPDLIAGQVPLGFQWFPNVLGPLGAKGAKALAVAGDKRLSAVPDAPTTATSSPRPGSRSSNSRLVDAERRPPPQKGEVGLHQQVPPFKESERGADMP